MEAHSKKSKFEKHRAHSITVTNLFDRIQELEHELRRRDIAIEYPDQSHDHTPMIGHTRGNTRSNRKVLKAHQEREMSLIIAHLESLLTAHSEGPHDQGLDRRTNRGGRRRRRKDSWTGSEHEIGVCQRGGANGGPGWRGDEDEDEDLESVVLRACVEELGGEAINSEALEFFEDHMCASAASSSWGDDFAFTRRSLGGPTSAHAAETDGFLDSVQETAPTSSQQSCGRRADGAAGDTGVPVASANHHDAA